MTFMELLLCLCLWHAQANTTNARSWETAGNSGRRFLNLIQKRLLENFDKASMKPSFAFIEFPHHGPPTIFASAIINNAAIARDTAVLEVIEWERSLFQPSKMSFKLFAVLAVLMLVSQAMCGGLPGILDPDQLDSCDPADEKTCLEGYVCVHVEGCHPDPPNPPICHPHNKCVPKGVEIEPVQDHHVG
ncbi:hypothetical protein DdX_19592 [Ditylenchus destructor]|uniref:Uncharacterized protein n=1 Tax=Ditylenchus destructor TaxID=166010 RepID=A0AAD4MJF3_9BILA|nr:hypothetical protein DdX_19592 [Ditylenchus destructor]